MIDLGKRSLLGVGVNAIDYEAAVQRVLQYAMAGRGLTVSATAVHGLMDAHLNMQQRYRLNKFDLVVPDGQPLVWALNRLWKTELTERVYGPKLTELICGEAARLGLSCYFYGSHAANLERLRKNLCERYPTLKIAGCSPSLFRRCSAAEKEEIAERIRTSGAQIVFVGLGCPRQEVWAYEYSGLLEMPLIAVGAAFDFLAGTLPQAPAWMQSRGLEWIFRLAQEPGRLWKRYLPLNPLFVLLIITQWLSGPGLFSSAGTPPLEELRYA
ncbi:MAG: WecB/TagA/CpsF family glycosyltransferase [Vulcanimicrobiota bacterium]